MEWKKQLLENLKLDEGLRLKPYLCPAEKKTIGIGRNIEDVGFTDEEVTFLGLDQRNIDDGITEEEAIYLCRNDIERCHREAQRICTDFESHPDDIKRVLLNMLFNLGETRFRQFRKMIAAIEKRNYSEAADEAKNSRWYNQVGDRAGRIVETMRLVESYVT